MNIFYSDLPVVQVIYYEFSEVHILLTRPVKSYFFVVMHSTL